MNKTKDITHTPSRPLFLYLKILAFITGILLAFRLAFWFFIAYNLVSPASLPNYVHPNQGSFSWVYDILSSLAVRENWQAFYIGFRFDARIAAILSLPFAIILSVPALARRLKNWSSLVFVAYALIFLLLVTIYFGDFGFYTYLGVRINTTVIELLQDTSDSLRMLWQSYHVIPIAIGGALLSLLFTLVLCKLVQHGVEPSPNKKRRTFGWLTGFIILAIAAYGQISSNLFPLRWSNAYVFSSQSAIALALNPIQNLYDTWRFTKSADFDIHKTQADYQFMANFLGVEKPDAKTLDYERKISVNPAAKELFDGKSPNIVIIIMESLGYPKTSFAPATRWTNHTNNLSEDVLPEDAIGPDGPTPHLKALAAESFFYDRFFANTRTTARAVFTIMTGIPDVNADGTASRNPYVVNQHLIANNFEGYNKFYMIGGSTSWANIRAVLSYNIPDIKIMEEGNWKSTNVDVWGISDYDLFQEAGNFLSELEKSDGQNNKPFLAIIQTSSFHRPYTIPETPGFEKRSLNIADQKNYGFLDEQEYNSMRYVDFSLNEFMHKIKDKPYYNNTIFFIFGDHGLNDSFDNMPEGYSNTHLAGWHTPMIMHIPALAAKGLTSRNVIHSPASHVDIFPTAASLAGIAYSNSTMGRDLFDPQFDDKKVAYIGGNQGTELRLVAQDGNYCYLDNRAGGEHLYKLDDHEGKDFAGENPELFQELKKTAHAIDDTAKYMLYHNKEDKKK